MNRSCSPSLLSVVEEEGVVLDALSRFTHPISHELFPVQVMLGLLMAGEIVLRAVGLVEHEAGGVVLGLQDVESQIARFVAGVAGVVEGCCDELRHVWRLDKDGYANDVHETSPFADGGTGIIAAGMGSTITT